MTLKGCAFKIINLKIPPKEEERIRLTATFIVLSSENSNGKNHCATINTDNEIHIGRKYTKFQI